MVGGGGDKAASRPLGLVPDPDRVDEEDFRQAPHHGLGAGPFGSGFVGEQPQGIVEPGEVDCLGALDEKYAGQLLDQRMSEIAAELEMATDEACGPPGIRTAEDQIAIAAVGRLAQDLVDMRNRRVG